VTVVAVTDGEAADPHRPGLAAVRRREQAAALAALGATGARVHRLGLPDGAVADHEDALQATLEPLAAEAGLVVAPWPLDHHPDHEAAGRAARGAAGAAGTPAVGWLFWAWHHPPPVADPPALGRLVLGDEERARRGAAVAAHPSQLTGAAGPRVVDHAALAPTRWPHELHVVP
jgi:LmbE family N-acetylglucosaminyl deacetylase